MRTKEGEIFKSVIQKHCIMKTISLFFLFCLLFTTKTQSAAVVEEVPYKTESYKEVTPQVEVMKEPKYALKKPQLKEATKPGYEISKANFRIIHHPSIHIQSPEVQMAYPQRKRRINYSYPFFNSEKYGFSENFPDLDEYHLNIPRLRVISPPGVWIDQPRHFIYTPKVRLNQAPQYPTEPQVEVDVKKPAEIIKKKPSDNEKEPKKEYEMKEKEKSDATYKETQENYVTPT